MEHCLVIPTAGRTTHLADCLSSLQALWPLGIGCEVIVVDNNQDLAVSRAVREIIEANYFARYSRCSSPGLTAARHHALCLTDAPIISFLDDDVEFSSTWFAAMAEAFKEEDICLVGGPTIPRFTGTIPSWFWDFFRPTPYGGWANSWLSLIDIGEDVDDINPNWIWGLNFSIRRSVLDACGGFHVDLVPRELMRWQGDGETGLTSKIAAKGYKAVYRQNALLFHQCGPERLNPGYFAKRAYFQGVCDSFTELRKVLRANTEGSSIKTLAQGLLLRALRKAKLSVVSRFPANYSDFSLQSAWAETRSGVTELCQQARREGYLFHQREAANDPKLRQWICRENFFDVDLREQYAEYYMAHINENILTND